MRNCAKDSSTVDSDTCVKNVVLASGMSCKTMKPNLPPPGNGATKNFRYGSDSNNVLTLVKEDFGLKKDSVVCASSREERLTENGEPTKHQIVYRSSKEQSKTTGMERLYGGSSFISSSISSEVDNFKSHVSKWCNNSSEDIEKENHFNEELKMSPLDSNIACNPVKEESMDEKVECTRGAVLNLGSSTVGETHCNIASESDKKNGSYVRNKVVRCMK